MRPFDIGKRAFIVFSLQALPLATDCLWNDCRGYFAFSSIFFLPPSLLFYIGPRCADDPSRRWQVEHTVERVASLQNKPQQVLSWPPRGWEDALSSPRRAERPGVHSAASSPSQSPAPSTCPATVSHLPACLLNSGILISALNPAMIPLI